MSLIKLIGDGVKGNIIKAKLKPSEESVRKYILKIFAEKGKAPTSKAIMKELSLSSVDKVNQIVGKLEKNDIVLRKNGRIVSAYPFSAKKTRHRVTFDDGHEVYALCSTDAMGIHFMLDENITVLSRCPESEKEMRIVLRYGKIVSCRPKSIVEFIAKSECGCCTAETFCPNMNFFYSRAYLEKWKAKNPTFKNGEIYMPEETLKHGRNIFGKFLK